MKAKLAGLALLMAASFAAQAHPGHKHNTLASSGTSNSSFAAQAMDSDNCGQHGGGSGTGNEGGSGGSPSPIPEPGTYAMLLAGLGLMTTIARRRQTSS